MIESVKQYLVFAKDLADQAGDIMLQYFQVGVANDLKEKEGNTPVTIADTTINRLVIDSVRDKYPTHAVIGEEQSFDHENAEYVWVCDPIDGTAPFVMGVPTNVFSLAMVDPKDGQPVMAVVYDPYMKRKYWATKNGGACMNGKPISVNKVDSLDKAMVGGSSKRSNVVRNAELRAAIIARCFRSLAYSSTIYEAMLVASGQIAAAVFVGFGCHDVASSKLIVEEAGGKVTDVFGHEQRYDRTIKGAIVSNGLIHEQIVELAIQNKI